MLCSSQKTDTRPAQIARYPSHRTSTSTNPHSHRQTRCVRVCNDRPSEHPCISHITCHIQSTASPPPRLRLRRRRLLLLLRRRGRSNPTATSTERRPPSERQLLSFPLPLALSLPLAVSLPPTSGGIPSTTAPQVPSLAIPVHGFPMLMLLLLQLALVDALRFAQGALAETCARAGRGR